MISLKTKKQLVPGQSHHEIVKQLFGVITSAIAEADVPPMVVIVEKQGPMCARLGSHFEGISKPRVVRNEEHEYLVFAVPIPQGADVLERAGLRRRAVWFREGVSNVVELIADGKRSTHMIAVVPV